MAIAFGVEADPSVPDPIMGGADDVDAGANSPEVEVPTIATVGPPEEFSVLGEQANAGVGDGMAVLIDDTPANDYSVAFGTGERGICGESRGGGGHGTDGHHR